MGAGDRISNSAEELKGKAKQGLGEATDNDQLKNEGRADEASGRIKDRIEDVKDAASDAVRNVKDRLGGDKK